MATKDIKYTNDELQIVGGDWQIGEATTQHQELLLLSRRGDFKQSPQIGVGVIDFIDDDRGEFNKAFVTRMLEADGMEVDAIEFTNQGKIEIRANYPEA